MTNKQSEDDFEDLDWEGLDLPSRLQAGWRRSDGLRKMPRDRDLSDRHRSKRGKELPV